MTDNKDQGTGGTQEPQEEGGARARVVGTPSPAEQRRLLPEGDISTMED